MAVEITNWGELQAVNTDPSADYVLSNDIDKLSEDYSGIGDDFQPISGFDGTFDGAGYAIRDLKTGSGLFSSIGTDALITNLYLSVSASSVNFNNCGGLVTSVNGSPVISDVGVNADVTTEDGVTGLVIGDARNGATLERVFAYGTITTAGGTCGGIAGLMDGGQITDAYSLCEISAPNSAGGIVGNVQGTADFTRLYSAPAFPDGGSAIVDFAGDNTTFTDVYWDTEVSGESTSSVAATGLTTAEMKGASPTTTMGEFDYQSVWRTVEAADSRADADGYPILRFAEDDQLFGQDILTLNLSVTTDPVTDVGFFEATGNGEVTDIGSFADVEVQFEYGPTAGDSLTGSVTLSTPGSFSQTLDGLPNNTQIEARAVAYGDGHSERAAEGGLVTFTTNDAALSVQTSQPADVGSVSVTAAGEVTELVGFTDVDLVFEYGPSVGDNTVSVSGEVTEGPVEQNINTPADTQIEIRFAATTQDGDGAEIRREGSTVTVTTTPATLSGEIALSGSPEPAFVTIENLTKGVTHGATPTDDSGVYEIAGITNIEGGDMLRINVDTKDSGGGVSKVVTPTATLLPPNQ